MEISGLTALVTGAGRRIGRSIALALARAGADLVVHYHSSETEASSLADEIRSIGRKAWTEKQNLEEPERSEQWFRALSEQSGGIDILVNSASAFPEDNYRNIDADSLRRSMALHFLSPLMFTRSMAERGGVVVNILDTRAADIDPQHVSYHHGKCALARATREMALEFAPALRVNAVAPGLILPPEGRGEEWVEKLKSTNPLNDRGRCSDVADAVLFLCRADFITGQTVYVDGGRHLKGRSNDD